MRLVAGRDAEARAGQADRSDRALPDDHGSGDGHEPILEFAHTGRVAALARFVQDDPQPLRIGDRLVRKFFEGEASTASRTASSPNARSTLPLELAWAGLRRPTQLAMTTASAGTT